MADAFQDLLHVLHESVVEDRLVQFYVTEVTLALSRLAACLALLIERRHSKPQVVGS